MARVVAGDGDDGEEISTAEQHHEEISCPPDLDGRFSITCHAKMHGPLVALAVWALCADCLDVSGDVLFLCPHTVG